MTRQSKQIVVLGAGKVGRLVTAFLAHSGDYRVTAVDKDADAARAAAAGLPDTRSAACDLTDQAAVEKVIAGHDYVLSCAPFHCNVGIARAAKKVGLHYMDLTEDVAVTKAVAELARDSDKAFIPQCGLAPGFITIVAHHLAQTFDALDTVKMRVGALPLFPHNRLNYNLTWSTEGLVNEYRHPCEAVVGGELVALPPLEDLEDITIDGLPYEAFNTSGGLGSMAETYAGRVRNLDYKSIRYPGHRDLLKILMDDLRLKDDPGLMCRLFEHALPYTAQDVVLIVVTVTGTREGRFTQESYVNKVLHGDVAGAHWGAIQITTAAGLCAVLDLHAQGKLPQKGFVKQEEVSYLDFVGNRFGRSYARPEDGRAEVGRLVEAVRA
ncbi:MAG: saccharopine dehydrogenase NADP-binding domain-containing protein [Planctomycetes bacterium]|nr:saccharopine dehydrogenase NADP-binding domain-containing protein [Planctomycetota bacterium]